jgi:hypothetical protein
MTTLKEIMGGTTSIELEGVGYGPHGERACSPVTSLEWDDDNFEVPDVEGPLSVPEWVEDSSVKSKGKWNVVPNTCGLGGLSVGEVKKSKIVGPKWLSVDGLARLCSTVKNIESVVINLAMNSPFVVTLIEVCMRLIDRDSKGLDTGGLVALVDPIFLIVKLIVLEECKTELRKINSSWSVPRVQQFVTYEHYNRIKRGHHNLCTENKCYNFCKIKLEETEKRKYVKDEDMFFILM